MRNVPCPLRVCLLDDCYAASIHSSNCITLLTDLVLTVEIFDIAYGTSWNVRRRSWMRQGEEVELYLPKLSKEIYMH